MDYVIIGNSAAGVKAAETIREVDSQGQVTIVDREEYPFYSRVLTTYVLGGKLSLDKVFLRQKSDYESRGINVILGQAVRKLLPGHKTVELEDGRTLPFDKLLLATGSTAQVPEVEGVDLEGVFTLRNLSNLRSMMSHTVRGGRVVVAGGGPVSLKVAEALLWRGMQVTVAVASPRILSRFLEVTAASLVEQELISSGVELLLQEEIALIRSDRKVHGVCLKSGRELPADMVVLAKGVRPNLEIVDRTAISTDAGILVDQYLCSTEKDIYAAGDVAQAPDLLSAERRIFALWSSAIEQGKVAALNMAGRRVRYPGGVPRYAFNFNGLAVLAVGRTSPEECDTVYEKNGHQTYRQVILQGKRLVGTTLVGADAPRGWFASIGQEVGPDEVEAVLSGNYFLTDKLKNVYHPAGIRKQTAY